LLLVVHADGLLQALPTEVALADAKALEGDLHALGGTIAPEAGVRLVEISDDGAHGSSLYKGSVNAGIADQTARRKGLGESVLKRGFSAR
jgi:hypothetical protein